MKAKDISGLCFGRLVAIEFTGKTTLSGSRIWRCLCFCGNEKNVVISNLTNGHTQSCGCLQKDQASKSGEKRKGIQILSNQRQSKITNGLKTYQCSTCKDFMPKEKFYGNKRTVLGITSECKRCHTQTNMRTRNKERARDYNRNNARKLRAENIEKFRQRERKYFHVKDEKYFARMELRNAVISGKVTKPTCCSECGISMARLNGHHHDYTLPLEVMWLCYECHGKKHRKIAT